MGWGAVIGGCQRASTLEHSGPGGMIWYQEQGPEPWPPPGALRLSSGRAGESMLAPPFNEGVTCRHGRDSPHSPLCAALSLRGGSDPWRVGPPGNRMRSSLCSEDPTQGTKPRDPAPGSAQTLPARREKSRLTLLPLPWEVCPALPVPQPHCPSRAACDPTPHFPEPFQLLFTSSPSVRAGSTH